MTPCRAAVLLVLAPLAFGILVGLAAAGTVLAALEDAEREWREDASRETLELVAVPEFFRRQKERVKA